MEQGAQYPWYDTVPNHTPLSQGDILMRIPVPMTAFKEDREPHFLERKITYIDAVVMTQACDLEQGKVDHVTLCSIIDFSEALTKAFLNNYETDVQKSINLQSLSNKQKEVKKKEINKFIQGLYYDFHLINEFSSEKMPELTMPHKIVLLREFFRVPVASLNKVVMERMGHRIRLQPPYREHLANSFARNFNRIGLPIDIRIDTDCIQLKSLNMVES